VVPDLMKVLAPAKAADPLAALEARVEKPFRVRVQLMEVNFTLEITSAESRPVFSARRWRSRTSLPPGADEYASQRPSGETFHCRHRHDIRPARACGIEHQNAGLA